MAARIAIMGAGAVGCYAGAHMAAAGEDVTFVDPWPDHVEAMRCRGLTIAHAGGEPASFLQPVKAAHLTELQAIARSRPFDIAFVCMKSYDTVWATQLIAQYLAPGGFVVSLQNCMNEEAIASVVGWGRTVGCIASQIMVELTAPGEVVRGAGKGGQRHVVFRAGEVHGRTTDRAQEVARLVGLADSAMVTANLWGERWSKLVANVMANGVSAATGLTSSDCARNDAIRGFQINLAGEAVRVGQALGFQLEKIRGVEPDQYARASQGDKAALEDLHARLRPGRNVENNPRADIQRPSMAQDTAKGRRTEIELMNGYIAEKGAAVGVPAPSHTKLTEIVLKVERGQVKPSAALLGG